MSFSTTKGSRKVDMLSGPVFKTLLSMSIPIMIMNVVQNIYSLIDMTILGKYASDTAVGAIGTTATLISLCTGVFIGVSTGANVIVARRIGEGNREKVKKASQSALLFAAFSGIVLLIFGVVFSELLLKLINCPEGLLKDATLYFKLYFLGTPFMLVYNFSASLLRATGDTKRPMYFLITGGIVKIIVNYVCIVFFSMSVDGVALATIASNIVACTLSFTAALKSDVLLLHGFKKPKMDFSELKEMLHIGIPTGLQSFAWAFANTMIVSAVNSLGENATTGFSIAGQFDVILYNISIAASYAVIPYVSQNIGAKNIARAKKAVLNGVLITVIFGAGFGAIFALFAKELSSIISTTPEVLDYSCQRLVLIASTYFLCGINDVLGGALRGMGRPVIPTVSTFFFLCLIRFPWVLYVFPLLPNITVLILIWPIGWILSSITLSIFYFFTVKKLKTASN